MCDLLCDVISKVTICVTYGNRSRGHQLALESCELHS